MVHTTLEKGRMSMISGALNQWETIKEGRQKASAMHIIWKLENVLW